MLSDGRIVDKNTAGGFDGCMWRALAFFRYTSYTHLQSLTTHNMHKTHKYTQKHAYRYTDNTRTYALTLVTMKGRLNQRKMNARKLM